MPSQNRLKQNRPLDIHHVCNLMLDDNSDQLVELGLSAEMHAELPAMRSTYRDAERLQELAEQRMVAYEMGYNRLKQLMLADQPAIQTTTLASKGSEMQSRSQRPTREQSR